METHDGHWRLGSKEPLTVSSREIIGLTRDAAAPSQEALEGRSRILIRGVAGMGTLVVKSYLRGGMIAPLLKDRYVGMGACRARREFEILLRAARAGVNVPEPMVYLQRKRWIYQCWLLTRFIPNKGTLSRISQSEPASIPPLMEAVATQVKILVARGIHHVDLHPGNIILGEDGQVYILDFDKARVTPMGSGKLAEKYIHRWNRAIKKHHLPSVLLNPPF